MEKKSVPATTAEQADVRHEPVVDLELVRARRFLDRLFRHPYVAVVMTDDGPQVFVKGNISKDDLRTALRAIRSQVEEG